MFLFMFYHGLPLVFVVCFEDEQGSSLGGSERCVVRKMCCFVVAGKANELRPLAHSK